MFAESVVAKGHRAQHVATCPLSPTVLPLPVQPAQQRADRQQNAGSRTQSQTADVRAAGVALETSGDGVAKGATMRVCRVAALQRRSKGT